MNSTQFEKHLTKQCCYDVLKQCPLYKDNFDCELGLYNSQKDSSGGVTISLMVSAAKPRQKNSHS